MEREKKDCVIYGTELCGYLGSNGCDRCFVSELSEKQMEECRTYADNWRVTLSNIPENVDELHTSGKCAFCTGEPEESGRYAVVDLAHQEPEYKKGMFFGLGKKVRMRIGSIIQLPVCICTRCIRRMRMIAGLKIGGYILGIVLAVGTLLIPSFSELLNTAGWWLPFVYFVAMLLIGVLIGNVASALYAKKAAEQTRVNAFDVPIIAEMKERGWFALQPEKKGWPRVAIVKKKPRGDALFYGEFTAKNTEKPVDTPVE